GDLDLFPGSDAHGFYTLKCEEPIIDALHRSRMKPYLDEANQNEKKALALYQWHGELTAAVQEVLGVTEVTLRNAMDRALQDWNNARIGKYSSWLLEEPATPLRGPT
ncbi:MAG: hypothetical protein L0J32_08575, partial [Brevibacterium sp.]|nr:hypothetical protein [Brevibacterium sp.]